MGRAKSYTLDRLMPSNVVASGLGSASETDARYTLPAAYVSLAAVADLAREVEQTLRLTYGRAA